VAHVEFLSEPDSTFQDIGSCNGLDVKRPPQALGLKAWSSADGTVLGGSRNFRRRGLAGRSRSLFLWVGGCL
jgi:hypothetical protein